MAYEREEAPDLVIDGETIRIIRDAWMMSQAAFGAAIGKSREWVVLSEKADTRRVQRKTLEGIAEAMGVTPRQAWVVLNDIKRLGFRRKEETGYKIPGPDPAVLARIEKKKTGQKHELLRVRRCPYFDTAIAAGGWVDTVETRCADEAQGWVELPDELPRDAFCLRISGDSMLPDYPSSSVLVFVPVRPGDHGAQFEAGKDYYVEHCDQKATFKRVYYEPGAERYRLESLNKKHKPMHVPVQMVARLSRAVRLIREL